jgi:hypothetical protein
MAKFKPVRFAKQPEKAEERKFVKAAKEQGWKTRKLNGLGNRNWPDQLVVVFDFVGFIEFKREGEDPREAQARLHTWLKDNKANVLVTTSHEEAIHWAMFRGKKR